METVATMPETIAIVLFLVTLIWSSTLLKRFSSESTSLLTTFTAPSPSTAVMKKSAFLRKNSSVFDNCVLVVSSWGTTSCLIACTSSIIGLILFSISSMISGFLFGARPNMLSNLVSIDFTFSSSELIVPPITAPVLLKSRDNSSCDALNCPPMTRPTEDRFSFMRFTTSSPVSFSYPAEDNNLSMSTVFNLSSLLIFFIIFRDGKSDPSSQELTRARLIFSISAKSI